MCDETNHLAKDYSYWVIRATPITTVRSRGSTSGLGHRGSEPMVVVTWMITKLVVVDSAMIFLPDQR